MLPEVVRLRLKEHLDRVKKVHARDLTDGYGRLQMPYACAEISKRLVGMGLAVRVSANEALG
jgi:hypothetical protein